MAFIAQHFVGRTVFRFGYEKWSETVRFPTLDPEVAKQDYRDLLNYRAILLGAGLSIDYAALHLSDTPRDSYLPGNPAATQVAGDPSTTAYFNLGQYVDAEMALANIDNASTGLLYALYTSSGKSANHLIRGVRDTWVAAGILTVAVTNVYAAPAAGLIPAAAPTSPDALKNYMSLLVANTAWFKPAFGGGWNYFPWAEYAFQRISSRKTGSGYKQKARRKHLV